MNNIDDVSKSIKTKIIVAKDGTSEYTTVQAAIDSVPAHNKEPIIIYIKNGIYKEEIVIPQEKPCITMVGESLDGTILTYDNYSAKEKPTGGTYGTTGSASVFIYGDDFIAENITFENSFNQSLIEGSGKQAVAVYAAGERQCFIRCRFIGKQDTLYVRKGTQYFYQSHIEGDVDFIFGEAQAVFEECDIVSLDRGSDSNNGFITAASTRKDKSFGYLFIHSRLISKAKKGTVYLGRPWHPGGAPDAIASVLFMDSYLGEHIHPDGWTDMSGFKAEDARFYEFQNKGPGAIEHIRGEQLSEEEVARWTIENVLNGWNPKNDFKLV